MDFSLDRFYRLNRKAIIWIVLFGLIYLLRDFFTLIFLTFILGFFAIPAARFLSDRLRLGRGLAIILVYALIASSYVWLVYWIFPSVIAQMSSIQAKLPVIQAKLKDLPDELEKKYPNLVHLSGFDVESSLLTDGDVIDWTGFYQRLSQSWDSSSTNPRRRIMEMLPDSTRRLIQQAAAEQPAGLAAKPESSASVPSPADPNAPHQLQPANSLEGDASIPAATGPARAEKENQRDAQIIEALNQNVITRRDFYRPTDFRGILLPDAGRELLARNHAELTPGQVEKLNRLLIEATFPEIIVKRRYLTEEKIDKIINQYRTQLQDYMPSFAGQLFDFFVTSLLATLFSFLIAFDYTRLQREVQSLARSKLHDFFEEAGQPVVKFALSVGYGFQAQIFIAVVTVALLIPTLIILRIPSLALLTVITFLTGLVPVIGALIQGVLIMLVALNEQGIEGALWAMGAVVVVHGIVTYVAVPYIFGRHFKLNIVAVLFILYLGHHMVGVWGVVLGIPIANYFLRDVLKVPILEEKEGKLTSAVRKAVRAKSQTKLTPDRETP